jgi:hypothetical protein
VLRYNAKRSSVKRMMNAIDSHRAERPMTVPVSMGPPSRLTGSQSATADAAGLSMSRSQSGPGKSARCSVPPAPEHHDYADARRPVTPRSRLGKAPGPAEPASRQRVRSRRGGHRRPRDRAASKRSAQSAAVVARHRRGCSRVLFSRYANRADLRRRRPCQRRLSTGTRSTAVSCCRV